MFVILVGPKGSGKSHIGRILEARLGVHFFHVEPLWLAYHRDCKAAERQPMIAEGIARVHPLLARALAQHPHVCVETTGASSEILDALLSLRPRSEIVIARVTAPLELCLHRISTRDQTDQIPLETETVRKVYALSESLSHESDITLNNMQLTEQEIVEPFKRALTAEVIHPRQLVRAWVDAFNRADPDALAAFYAEDAVNHQVAESPVHGRRAIREMFAAGFASATMVCEVENIFEDGEWGILEWRDPLGLRGCGFFHIVGGQIVFQRGYWDKLSFLRAHGLPLPDKT
ncbi:MAG: nuclear transport factor 2 family protein [Polyangiaceae bacterium]|nr:nuclear transport factor 2 family protein [Polyangiaceae bacterium]